MIRREQFVRAFNALKADQDRRDAVEEAAIQHGMDGFCLGSSPVATELENLLTEICRDREDDNGPWPEDSCGEGDISLALHWSSLGSIFDGVTGERIRDFPTTAEGVWEMWEREQTGPFRPARGQVVNLGQFRPHPDWQHKS